MKIKGLIFDLDGVLVDTKKIHFVALNIALKSIKFEPISFKDHINIYDGLPTLEKLKILKKRHGLNKKFFSKIQKIKQIETQKLLNKNLKYNPKIFKLFSKLSKKYKICIATNAVNKTLEVCLKKLRIRKFIFSSFSNQDVVNNKPHPEIYLKCLIDIGCKPNETLIFEDSSHGVMAAQDSGSHLFTVKNLSDISYNNILNFMKNLKKDKKQTNNSNYWSDPNLNILIPMAGAGSRFKEAGYIFPKPLIEIDNKPMIQWVI